MGRINSLRKGKSGEREVVHILANITGVEWKRVPSSGALFTTQGSEQFKGDVYSDHPDYKDIVVEVKNHKGSVALTDFAKPKSKINQWLKQMRDEAKGKKGILFFKSMGKWCWIPQGINTKDDFYVKLCMKSKCWNAEFGVI